LFGVFCKVAAVKQELRQVIQEIKEHGLKEHGLKEKRGCWKCSESKNKPHGNLFVECGSCALRFHLKCMDPPMYKGYLKTKLCVDFGQPMCWTCKAMVDCEEECTTASLWKEINRS